MLKSIGALWVREYEKDGDKRKMLSGQLDLGALGTVNIAIFKNEGKEKDNQPDYRIFLSNQEYNQKESEEGKECKHCKPAL